MKTYLKKAFQLSDSGAKGLVKSIWSFFLYYVSFVPPMICVFLFADRLLHGNTGKPVVYLLFMLVATLVMYLVINSNYKTCLLYTSRGQDHRVPAEHGRFRRHERGVRRVLHRGSVPRPLRCGGRRSAPRRTGGDRDDLREVNSEKNRLRPSGLRRFFFYAS